MNTAFDLSTRVAIVTGGNGGIGLGMALGLARSGATVVVVGRNAAKNDLAVAERGGLWPIKVFPRSSVLFQGALHASLAGRLGPQRKAT